jgi:hypothetical protein
MLSRSLRGARVVRRAKTPRLQSSGQTYPAACFCADAHGDIALSEVLPAHLAAVTHHGVPSPGLMAHCFKKFARNPFEAAAGGFSHEASPLERIWLISGCAPMLPGSFEDFLRRTMSAIRSFLSIDHPLAAGTRAASNVKVIGSPHQWEFAVAGS